MGLGKAMFQADLNSTLLASVGVNGSKLLLAALCRTSGPVVDFGIVGRIATLLLMPLKGLVWVIVS